MRDFFDVVWFHLKLFAKNSYFRTIVFVTTISFVLVQYVAAYAVQDLGNKTIWLRAGIIGTWAAGTSAAGVIPFQRAQGTLGYILDSRKGDAFSLSTLIIPAACFGLLSFPIAFVTSYALGIDVSSSNWLLLMLGILSLWFSVILLDFVVAGSFVLTPNAFLYEGILMAPILIGAGIYKLPGKWDTMINATGYVLPMTTPVKLILNPTTVTYIDLIQMIVCSIIWLVIAKLLLVFCLKKVRINGDMEAI